MLDRLASASRQIGLSMNLDKSIVTINDLRSEAQMANFLKLLQNALTSGRFCRNKFERKSKEGFSLISQCLQNQVGSSRHKPQRLKTKIFNRCLLPRSLDMDTHDMASPPIKNPSATYGTSYVRNSLEDTFKMRLSDREARFSTQLTG